MDFDREAKRGVATRAWLATSDRSHELHPPSPGVKEGRGQGHQIDRGQSLSAEIWEGDGCSVHAAG